MQFLLKAKELGYLVELVFITTADPHINVERVRQRHETGGHDVPADKIISRYQRSMALLPFAIALADIVKVYDNSSEHPEIVLMKTIDGSVFLLNQVLPTTWIEDAIITPLVHKVLSQIITSVTVILCYYIWMALGCSERG